MTTEYLGSDAKITVLSEPQPEEPTTFGARVMAGGLMFVRGVHHERPWMVSLDGELYDWNDLCGLGPVTVIEAEPYWEIPTDVDSDPEVPERIEEWPEDDTALRKHKWRDLDGRVWVYTDGGWRTGSGWPGRPEFGPWGRVTDA